MIPIALRAEPFEVEEHPQCSLRPTLSCDNGMRAREINRVNAAGLNWAMAWLESQARASTEVKRY